jgi:hypothetical protein
MIKALFLAAQGQRGMGYLHDKLPDSVKPLHTLIGASSVLPDSASVRDLRVSPKNQSSTDSCLGMSGAQAWRISALKLGLPCPDLSGLVPYKLGRASLGMGDQDNGMSYGGLTAAVERFGMASEESYPFSVLKVNWNIPATALHDAYDRRGIRGIYAIDQADADGVRRALAKGICVIGAWQVDGAFMTNTGDTLIDVPTGSILGYHSMVIEDYEPDGTFGILNHYDIVWRLNGRCRFTERYVKSSMGFLAFDLGVTP